MAKKSKYDKVFNFEGFTPEQLVKGLLSLPPEPKKKKAVKAKKPPKQ